MDQGKIYIIVVTFNGSKWIDKCLTCARASDTSVNIILIDNCSTDNTKDIVLANHSDVDFIESSSNLGFGKANNIGMQKALAMDADYIFLLNQDAYLEPNTISGLIAFHRRNPTYGILSPWQMNGIGNDLDKNFSEYVLRKENCLNETEECIDVTFVMAAFWLISKNCLKKVGLFDPIFKHYGEDNDFANRVIYHQFKIGLVKNLFGYHDRTFSTLNTKKLIHVNYSSLLATSININKTLAGALTELFYYHAKFSVKNLLKFKFGDFVENQKKMRLLISDYKGILASRRRNKMQ